ncbi:MAG TPA: cysteine desulfurase-like protein [Candidatus Eisenbacteria bacterium]|nr:cysteine desulfurase-like protein [Candidatus Eisenbacteria bacterium]
MSRSDFPVDALRARFPALREAGDREIFFDNAAGAQVPDDVIEAMREHLVRRGVNRGGLFARSIEVDRQIAAAREAVAAFLNARSPEEIVFGLNSTSLIRTVAEAVRPLFSAGDRVIVTQLDHEANVGPWLRLERDGVVPLVWKVRGTEARLDLDDLRELLRESDGRARLVAMPLASNAIGRIVDVAAAARVAHEAGALAFVDAVHFAPHGPIDVQALGADFLAFSGYKIFGPHIGFVWGRADSYRRLTPVHDFFIPAEAPYGYEGGTQNFEAMAGMAAALRYVMEIGAERIRAYETELASALLEELRRVPGLSILGDADPARVEARVPTVAFTIERSVPRAIVERLAERGIHAREGHMYAPRLLEAVGRDAVARVSLCHYNTRAEITRLGEALRSLG